VTPFRRASRGRRRTEEHPFFRSYGAILPSSLTRVRSSTLGYSPHPPVSVCGTGSPRHSLRGFSWQRGFDRFMGRALPIASRSMEQWICLPFPPTSLDPVSQHRTGRPFCVTPSFKRVARRYRNICLFAIAYAFRPRLRTRLTLSGLTFLRNPWVFGGRVSRPSYRYSFRHNLFPTVQPPSRTAFTPLAMLPYRSARRRNPWLR